MKHLKEISRTEEGFLIYSEDWTPEIAQQIAQEDSLELTDDHWEILNFVRNYYLEFKTSPGLRELIKAMKPVLGESKANSLALFKLFPQGSAKQISRLAGLPKPKKCI